MDVGGLSGASVPVRVATLNAWLMGFNLTPSNAERRVKIVEHAHSANIDVLALQEVWAQEDRKELVRLGAQQGYLYSCGHERDGGLIVLSRLPLSDISFRAFENRGLPTPSCPDYWSRKGVLRCTVGTKAGPLRLANTHLVARYTAHGDEEGDEFTGHRAGQLAELLAYAGLSGRESVLLCGDLNLQTHDPEFQALVALGGLEDVTDRAGVEEPAVSAVPPSCAPLTKASSPRGGPEAPWWRRPLGALVPPHPYATCSLWHSPFTHPQQTAKKLDHVLVRNPALDSCPVGPPVRVSSATLEFTDVWMRDTAQFPLYQPGPFGRLLRWLVGAPEETSRLTYSDHVGLCVTVEVGARPVPQAASPSSSEPLEPSTAWLALASRMAAEAERTRVRVRTHGGIACAGLAGVVAVRLLLQGRPRLARALQFPLALTSAACAWRVLEGVREINALRRWQASGPAAARPSGM